VGLPPQVAQALSVLGWPAQAVGQPGAPVANSSDEENCEWCKRNGNAVLVTTDRGKKDRTIFDHLAQHQVDAIFVHNDLRFAPTHELARAILNCEGKLDTLTAGRGSIQHRLRPGGGLAKGISP
jgi:hypothetical protein